MTTKQRSIIYFGLPVGVAVALLLVFFFALPGGAVGAPDALASKMIIYAFFRSGI